MQIRTYSYGFCSFLLVLIWFFTQQEKLFTDYVSGYDSYRRLYAIDHYIVYLNGQPWLPFYQSVLKLLSNICDSPQCYKLLTASFAMLFMAIVYTVQSHFFGFVPALVTFSYFFIDYDWILVSTSIYMEPLFCLLVILWLLLSYHERQISSIFLILATLTRPELLLASPILVTYHYIYRRKIYRTGLFALHFLPVTVLYIALKVQGPHFASPATFDLGVSYNLLKLIFENFFQNPLYMVHGAFALVGLGLIISKKDFLPEIRNILLATLLFVIAFYLIFVLVAPYFHHFSPRGTRKSIYLELYIFTLSSIPLVYLKRIWPKITIVLIGLYFICTVFYLQIVPAKFTPIAYHPARKFDKLLRSTESFKEKALTICDPVTRPISNSISTTSFVQAFIVHLRFLGWKVKSFPCSIKNLETYMKDNPESRNILIFRRFFPMKYYYEQIKELCTIHVNIYLGKKRYITTACMAPL